MLVALVLPDLEPADPPAFNTVLPEWHSGDEFLAGEQLQPFRIVAVVEDAEETNFAFDAVWVVEPVVA